MPLPEFVISFLPAIYVFCPITFLLLSVYSVLLAPMVARRLEGLGAILVQLALPDRFHYFLKLVGRVFSYLAQNVGVALKCLLFSFCLLIEIEHVALVAGADL